jgi:predicted secreted protein with PEFG-CTERM motif
VKLPLLALLGFFVMLSFSLGDTHTSFAQSNNCPSCVQILPEDIDLYKTLFPITIWTDSTVYDHNSAIKISGYLRPENNVAPILVVVTNPIGNVVTIDQISPGNTGDFSFTLDTQSPLWKQDGDYIIKVQSGSDNRQFKTKVTLVSHDVDKTSKCLYKEILITADDGQTYCLPFKSSNGVALNVNGTLKLDAKTISFQIRGQDAATIIIDIPRYLLDSKSPSGDDSDFVVLANGEPIEYQQLGSDDDSRQIQISFLPTMHGNYEIIGTHVIPEFGSLVYVVLIGSLLSIMILGRSFTNRFVKF